jgi:iron only hydrogenase large subunit-like protein
MAGSSSAAALAEVSGGMAEGVIRLLYFKKNKKEADKQLFKKLRSGSSFRETTIEIGESEINIAIVDGLTGLEKLKASFAAGEKYDLVEVMACAGGCINGAGLPFTTVKDDRKSRAKMIYQADETDAISLPCKSPVLINLFDNLIKENKDISDKKIFHTHFEKRDVLL